jgi:hypothetical protein
VHQVSERIAVYAYPNPPPDLQVLHSLKYLRERLRSDEILNQYFPSPDSIVNGTMMRPILIGDETGLDLHVHSLPYLAIYRGNQDRNPRAQIGTPGTEADAHIEWFASMPAGEAIAPQGETVMDALQWGAGLVYLIWARICYHLETDADYRKDFYDDAHIDLLRPEKIGHPIQVVDEDLIGFQGMLTLEHTHPQYDVPDLQDLTAIAFNINLHAPIGTEPGFSIGAEIDVST